MADARTMDFFGEGLDATPAAAPKAPELTPEQKATQDRAARLRELNWSATNTANINAKSDRTSGSGGAPIGNTMFNQGGVFDNFSDSTKAAYNYMHDLGKNDVFTTGREALNSLGENVGVSHAGDAANPDFFAGGIRNPITDNPLSALLDTNKGLGTNAAGGAPVAATAPGAANIATTGVGQIAGGAIGDALDQVMGGGGSLDTSGGDRGGMGLGGAYSSELGGAAAQGVNARGLGMDVLAGKTAAPSAADAQRQGDVLGRASGFAPTAQTGVMGKVDAFGNQPEGPSQAELLLQKGQQGAMADVLAAARSGRARDAGSQARAMNVAQGEIAAAGVDAARDAGLLRANEAATKRGQDLQALNLSGQLAQGIDANTLGALNLQGDLANQMRAAGIQERGQGLNFMQGQEQIGAGLTGDILRTIPQLEGIRHQDQFDLTPQQKLAAAKLGGAPDKTTADYVTGLLGDVLSVI